MFKKALVGVDLSPAERPLIGCLAELKRWGIDSLVLAHVIRVGYAQGAGFGHEDEYRSWLEKRAGPLRDAGLDVSISVTASGVPADELVSVAKGSGADLVVVGSRSRSFVHGLFLGSVATDVIRKSDIPVLIERIEPTEEGTAEGCAAVCANKLDRILLATDHSARSRSAEEAAVILAPRAATTDGLTVLSEDEASPDGEAVSAAERNLSDVIRRIEAQGGRGRARVERGEPAEVIAKVAQEGYSLIILGKHGQNWIEGMTIGSTAAKVCEAAKRPVLMVPTT